MAKQWRPADVSRYYDPNIKVTQRSKFQLTPQQLSDLQRVADLERKSANAYIEIGPGRTPQEVAECKFPVHLD